MKHLYLFLSLVGSLFLCTCVSRKSSENEEAALPQKTAMEENYSYVNMATIADSLHFLLPDSSCIKQFYADNHYDILWVKDIYEHAALDSLVYYMTQSSEHGLNPARFKQPELVSLLDSLQNNLYGKDDEDRIHQAFSRLEMLCSQAYIDYVTGMKYGFVNPRTLFPKDYFIEIQTPDSVHYANLFVALKNTSIDSLQTAQPADKQYRGLQALLKTYAAWQDSAFVEIPFDKKKKNLTLNQADTILPLVAKRLMITGELAATEHIDSLYSELTPDLLAAINRFQVNNSYPELKELDGITVASLNRPLSYYHQVIEANLERSRWKKVRPNSDKRIHVNVAAFMLQAFEPDEEPVTMNVCVGIAVKNQTPLMESDITYMNLNPNWNVPQSIFEKEIYWHLLRDSTYLQKNRMQVLTRSGEVVNPTTITWKSMNPKKSPYLIRQEPGDANSLGRIKFMFNNPFAVYLHDTPSKRRFLMKNRAVSHGCVRVQNPMDLARVCLTNKDSVYFDRLRHSIDLPPLSAEGRKLLKAGKLKAINDIVNLDKKVQVIIDYATAYPLADGNFYFADDVYLFDEKIREAMKTQENHE